VVLVQRTKLLVGAWFNSFLRYDFCGETLCESFNSLLTMSFGGKFCGSRKGGTRGGGQVSLQNANRMAMSAVEMSWLVLERLILSFLPYMDLETSYLSL